MNELNKTVEIPAKLLGAAGDRRKYFMVIEEYYAKYCCKNYRDAWEYLEIDLGKFGLSRYSTYQSFKNAKSINHQSR